MENENKDQAVINKNKVLYFFGEINPSSAGNFICALQESDSLPGLNTVFMFSGGGEVNSAMGMYDAIKCTKNQVLTVAIGEVASAAVLPFVAGDVRLMYRNSQIFLHETRSIFPSEHAIKQADLTKVAFNGEDVFQTYCNLLAENVKIPVSKIMNMCIDETYLNPEQAGKVGFCDGIHDYNQSKTEDRSSDLGKAIAKLASRRRQNVRKAKKK